MAKLYDRPWREGKTPLDALRQAQLTVYRHPARLTELAQRGPTAAKTLRIPLEADVAKAGTARAATPLWAEFVLSGPGQ